MVQATGLATVLERFLVKINDVKVLILSTFDGVELMTGMFIEFTYKYSAHITLIALFFFVSLQRLCLQRSE